MGRLRGLRVLGLVFACLSALRCTSDALVLPQPLSSTTQRSSSSSRSSRPGRSQSTSAWVLPRGSGAGWGSSSSSSSRAGNPLLTISSPFSRESADVAPAPAAAAAAQRRRWSHVRLAGSPFGRGQQGRSPLGGGRSPNIFPLVFLGLLLFAPRALGTVINTLFLGAIVVPLALFLGFSVWTKVNVVESPCPQCNSPLQGLKGQQSQCPSCGCRVEAMGGKGGFKSLDPVVIRNEQTGERGNFIPDDDGIIDV